MTKDQQRFTSDQNAEPTRERSGRLPSGNHRSSVRSTDPDRILTAGVIKG